MRRRIDVDGCNTKSLPLPSLPFSQMRFQLLQLQITFPDIVGALCSNLLDSGLHALHLLLHAPDGRLRTGDIRLQRALLALCQGQRSTQIRCLCSEFTLQ